MQPLLSVLIPIYNTEQYLCRCIESVINQSYRIIQIVLVNDGSSDKSEEVCMSFVKKDQRIEYYSIQHIGISLVRNYLIKLAKGKYSIFIDSDDWIDNGMFQYLISVAERNNADMVALETRFDELKIDKTSAIKFFLYGGIISSSLCYKLVKTQIYQNVSFEKSISYGEDVYCTWLTLNLSNVIILTDKSFYHYNNTPNSITNKLFSNDTYSLHFVWEKITEETKSKFPKFEKLALRQLAYNYIWLLYSAIRSNISGRDQRVKNIQLKLRSLLGIALTDRRNSIKCRIFALISTYFYSYLNFIITPFRNRLSPLR